jgi:hypothetical protein
MSLPASPARMSAGPCNLTLDIQRGAFYILLRTIILNAWSLTDKRLIAFTATAGLNQAKD